MEQVADCPEISKQLSGTIYGAMVRRQLSAPHEVSHQKSKVSARLICAVSLAWVITFLVVDLEQEALAWSVALVILAAICLSWMCAAHQIAPLSMLKFGENRKTTFIDSFAMSFITLSGLLGGWLMFHHFHPVPPIVAKRQVIEIELVSNNDYKDRHDPLPGSIEKPTQKRNIATAEKTVQSKTLAIRTTVINQARTVPSEIPSQTGHRQVQSPLQVQSIPKSSTGGFDQIIIQSHQNIAGSKPSDQPVLMQGQALSTAKAKAVRVIKGQDTPMFEEVKPPQMVEITDSDGESKGQDVWQPGGHSTGGTGAQTGLVSYLKELHKRIKRAWAPPESETRSAQIMFRIKRSGGLASIRLIQSSGSSESDESAMHAVAACSPFHALPPDYPASYLDLLYTFNYNVDELSEVPGSATE